MNIFEKSVLHIAVLLLIMQMAVAEDNKSFCCRKTCPKGADITKLDLKPVNITVAKNYPHDTDETINLVAKIASQNTGGKDVLFLHGFPHCHLLWKNQLADPKLRTKHNLYTLDFRGQGESDKPAPSAPPAPDGTDTVYRPWQNYANDIHQTIVQLELDKPVLVSHSMGTYFVNDYFRMYGNSEISGFVTVAGIPDPVNTISTLTLWFSPEILALLGTGNVTSTNLEQFIPGTQVFVALSQAGAPCKLNEQDLQEILMHDTYLPGPTRGAIANHDGLPPISTGLPSPNDTVWAAITVPSLVIHGVNHHAILFAAGEHLAQVIPTATFRPFQHGSHFLLLQQTKEFNKVLLNFIDSL